MHSDREWDSTSRGGRIRATEHRGEAISEDINTPNDLDAIDGLLEQARSGNADAVNGLVARFQDMAVGYAFSVVGDWDCAADAAQEAFVEALGLLDRVYSGRAFPAWLRRIVFKHCDRLTRGRRLERLDGVEVDPAPDALTQLTAAETREWVWRELRRLPEQERIAVTLFYVSGKSHAEIAAFLDIGDAAVNNRLRRARRTLKERLETMAEDTLRAVAPSQGDGFVNAVAICHAARAGDVEALRRILAADPTLVEAVDPHIQGRAHFYPGWSSPDALDLCRRFDLPLEWRACDLSRGNRAKLALVAALAAKPRLLLLDEPTAGLDPVVRDDVLGVLFDLIERGDCSLFYSTHILSDIARLADELALQVAVHILRGGHHVAAGPN